MFRKVVITTIVFIIVLFPFAFFTFRNVLQQGDRLSELKARRIAENSCIKGGKAMYEGKYNNENKTWEYEANLNAVTPGCRSLCVVSESTKNAEIVRLCEPTPAEEVKTEITCNPASRASDMCIKIYKPVCGLTNVQCIKAPCEPIRQTYGNSCEACSNDLVSSYYEGECKAL